MFPYYIIEKLNYYKWRILQNKLCKEYHECVKDNNIYQDGSTGVMLLCGGFPTWFNNRRLRKIYDNNKIRTIGFQETGYNLPKNYGFTMGDCSKINFDLDYDFRIYDPNYEKRY
tara:strand:+ start:16386 stop:16727 length:342 start_codon:yes stop_codon:yes gene_type:complete